MERRCGAPIDRRTAIALLLACSTATIANAQTSGLAPADELLVTGQAAMAGEAAPRLAGVEWLHSPRERPLSLDLGGFFGSSENGWFSYGRVGGTLRRGASSFTAAADLGRGAEGSTPFAYVRLRGLAAAPLPRTRAVAEAEVDRVRVAQSVVTGLRVGATMLPSARLSVRLSAHVYAAGEDVDPGVSVRADYLVRRCRLMGGGFVAWRGAVPSAPIEVSPTLYATRTVFAGVEIDAGKHDLIAVLDVSEQPRGRAATIVVGLKVPLR